MDLRQPRGIGLLEELQVQEAQLRLARLDALQQVRRRGGAGARGAEQAYDEGWREVAVFREDDTSPKEQFVNATAGLDGYGGSSYINDVVCRNRDANSGWTAASDGTLEERYYTKWYPFRLFHVAGAVFFDMGRTWGTDVTGATSDGLLKDVGLGLRLGSSRSAFGNVIHIDLAFPLDGGDDIDDVQFVVETKAKF